MTRRVRLIKRIAPASHFFTGPSEWAGHRRRKRSSSAAQPGPQGEVIQPELRKEVSTVKEYDPQTGLGIVVREDGSELRFGRADLISIPEAEAAIVPGAKLYHATVRLEAVEVEVCLPEPAVESSAPTPSTSSLAPLPSVPRTWKEVVALNQRAWERVRSQYPKGSCFEEIPEP